MRRVYKKPHRTERTPLPDAAVVFDDLLPDLQLGNNTFGWACCPFHDDHNPSLCVNVESGWYRCHASHCGAHGANIVSFVSALFGIEWRDAREYLETHYG